MRCNLEAEVSLTGVSRGESAAGRGGEVGLLTYAGLGAVRGTTGSRRGAEGGRWTVDGGWWTVDGGRWVVDGGQWTADGGWRRRTVGGGRLTIGDSLMGMNCVVRAVAGLLLSAVGLLLSAQLPPLTPREDRRHQDGMLTRVLVTARPPILIRSRPDWRRMR